MNDEQRFAEAVMRAATLMEKYLDGELTREEESELEAWRNESAGHKSLFKKLSSKESLLTIIKAYNEGKSGDREAKKRAAVLIFGKTAEIRPISSVNKRLSIAAAAILVIAAGAYLWDNHKRAQQVAKTEERKSAVFADAAPGTYKAKLTLSDGSTIVLDSAATGMLTDQGGSEVVNNKGGLVYKQATGKSKEVLFNTLTTAKGEMYGVTLSDGSKVWLNSASSIHYPVAFASERKVEIIGEAYFEVAKDLQHPFVVSVGGMEVRVLGTHFNINAYSDNSQVSTTLLEGSVKVTPLNSDNAVILQPGQQAQLSASGDVTLAKEVNIEKETAWKNGLFIFDGDDVKSVLNQLARWYNVEVVYKGNIPDIRCYGIISRRRSASTVLQALQLSDVHFKIENSRISVSQY